MTKIASGFEPLGLDDKLLNEIAALGYEEPTPIQRESIPPLIEGRDLLGQAATGTGKTAAFALPLLNRIAATKRRERAPMALVLVPTRELAVQVAEAVHSYGRRMGARVLPIYGGQPISRQIQALRAGVDIVIATPGRALDHIGRHSLALDQLQVVVLDEADEMLDMGFAEDIDTILSSTPAERQTVLFSATMPARIEGIARRHLKDPVRIRIAVAPPSDDIPKVRQTGYVVARAHKLAALERVLDLEAPTGAIIFCRTRTEVDHLAESMAARGYKSEALHGGMNQTQRDRTMKRIRSSAIELLIATDVAARGLDIEHLTHVINYDVPAAPEHYVHRIGRIGRAGRNGIAITLVEPREHTLVRNIERTTGQKIRMATLPSVADLRARKLELMRVTLREAIVAGESEHYRVIVDSLASEFDVVEIAMAAVKLAHEAVGEGAELTEIPEPRQMQGYSDDTRGSRSRRPAEAQSRGRERAPEGPAVQIHVGVGRTAGIGARDLLELLQKTARLERRLIGSIEIGDDFSLIELPASRANDVVKALRTVKLNGSKLVARVCRD